MPVLLLLHIPPEVASLNVVVEPWHTPVVPEIAGGKGLTVIVAVVLQPVELIVKVIVAVPVPEPVRIPEAEPMLAGPILLHTPPVVASVNVVLDPLQTLAAPVIAIGNGFTVTSVVVMQPVMNV